VIKGNSGSQLPRGWVWSKIGEVCTLVNGRAFKPSEWSSKGLPIIRIQNLNNPDAEFNYCDFTVEQKYYVDYGQLLFAWSGTPETSFGAHIWRRGKAVLNQHIFKVEIDERFIDKSFFMHLINYNVTEYIRKAHGTAGLAHITKGKFEDSFVAIPPFNEQRRIVARLEELFTRLDAGVEGLRKVKAQLKRYRQAVLKYAFEGKLTEEWRKTHKDQLEPATKLLERIKQERRGRLGTKYKEPPPIDVSGLQELPESWIWTRVGEISDIIHYGYTASSTTEPIGPKMLRITDIQADTVNWNDAPYCKIDDDTKQKYVLREGDLVFARTGATVGKSYLIRGNIPEAVFASYLIRIVLSKNVKKEFVYNFFHSPLYWLQIRKQQLGIGQPNVNSQILARIVLPLPSFPEQERIVEEIDSRLSVAEEIQKTLDRSVKESERLRQSILNKAFTGKLVPQDSSDEPADKLLERIKAERPKSKGEKDINKKKIKPKQLELSTYVK
jgi:type I restriction enzyme S subunit